MSITVRNLYKLNISSDELYEYFYKVRMEFKELLYPRFFEAIEECLDDFKVFYSARGKPLPQTEKQWKQQAGIQFKKDWAIQKTMKWIYDDSPFCVYLQDFDARILLLKHQKLGWFVQLYGSPWALEQLKRIMQLTEDMDYSYDNRSDNDNNTEERYEIIKELYSKGDWVPRDSGVLILISDGLPNE